MRKPLLCIKQATCALSCGKLKTNPCGIPPSSKLARTSCNRTLYAAHAEHASSNPDAFACPPHNGKSPLPHSAVVRCSIILLWLSSSPVAPAPSPLRDRSERVSPLRASLGLVMSTSCRGREQGGTGVSSICNTSVVLHLSLWIPDAVRTGRQAGKMAMKQAGSQAVTCMAYTACMLCALMHITRCMQCIRAKG